MRTKEFHTKSGSKYGERVASYEKTKEAIAKAVVQKILLRRGGEPHNPIFISDGTSSAYVWCHYLREWIVRRENEGDGCDGMLAVSTNNLDVPMEVLCHKNASDSIDVHVSPGKFSSRYCCNYGDDAEAWVREQCKESTCILAVTALDAELGPCGHDKFAKAIKRAVMETAKILIVVADNTKLQKSRDAAHAAAPDEWEKWMNKKSEGRLFVVTNRSPNVNWPYLLNRPEPVSLEIENETKNLRVLESKLNPNRSPDNSQLIIATSDIQP